MPIALIDRSDVTEQMRHQTLRASVSFEGRSVILYKRVFPFSQYNSPVSHKPFLRELAAILPERCCPLIVTDAGYRNTCFREVEKLDWFWLGGVRGEVSFREQGQSKWRSNKSFYPSANTRARYLGTGELGRKSPLMPVYICLKLNPKDVKTSALPKPGVITMHSKIIVIAVKSPGYWRRISPRNHCPQRNSSTSMPNECK